MGASLETTEAEKIEANQEKVEARMETCLEEAAVETTGTLTDRCGDQQLAVEYRNLRKRRNKDDVVRGGPKGRTFAKRCGAQRKCNNGIRDETLNSSYD
jgi:hypothetical protein